MSSGGGVELAADPAEQIASSIETRQGRAEAQVGAEAEDSIALFMLPGVMHCGGGPGRSASPVVANA